MEQSFLMVVDTFNCTKPFSMNYVANYCTLLCYVSLLDENVLNFISVSSLTACTYDLPAPDPCSILFYFWKPPFEIVGFIPTMAS